MRRGRSIAGRLLFAWVSIPLLPHALHADPCGGLRLVDVAEAVGLRFHHDKGARGDKHLPETMGAGAAWLDFDRDGWLDLYVVQSGPFPPDGSAGAGNRLYRNRGDGTFSDVSAASGAADRGYGQGVAAGDVNGDGWVDLYVCNYGPDTLLLNRGDGSFVESSGPAAPRLGGWSSSAAFADADGDGDLDLYVTRYLEYDASEELFCGDPVSGKRKYCDPAMFRGAADRFYRNRGDGTFDDATDAAGLGSANGKGLGVLFSDLDGDGRPDLYVANDLTINLVYRNRGDGTFEELSLLSGAGLNRQGKAEAGMGVALGDVDGDGDPDLAVTNFDAETNTLYRNLGGMSFDDLAVESGFGNPSFNLLGFGLVLADLDLDGDLDAYAANGHIFEEPPRTSSTFRQRDLLLLGDGRGGFEAAVCGPAFEAREVGRGLAAADYDNDGDTDLAVINNDGPLQLLRNEIVRARWLGVQLRGRPPNVEAIGARVALATERGRQVRWVTAGDSYQSSGDRRLLFGIAEGDEVRALEVAWPSGATRTFTDLPTGRYVLIDATTGELSVSGPPAASPALPGATMGIAAAGVLLLLGAGIWIYVGAARRRAGRH